MGCCGSSIKKFVVNNDVPGQDQAAYEAFQILYLKDIEIDKLYTSFCNFDINGSGEVSYIEFLAALDLEETPITKEIFCDMDDSHDFQMNFREFVLNMWNFCTRSKQSISTFAFDIFDDDDNGSLSPEEITDMVQRIYGKKGLSHDIKLIIKKMDKNKDSNIDKKEFIASVNSFPALLFPAFHLQTTFRTHCVNEKFWVEKQLQAASIRKIPAVIELFENRGKMAQRKIENDNKRKKKQKSNKVACDYDGVDLSAHMSEERREAERRQSEVHHAKHHAKTKKSKVNSEDDAARVIQAASIRKKNKKKRDQKRAQQKQ